MKRNTRTLAGLALLALWGSAALAGDGVKPGLWSQQTQLSGDGKTWTQTPGTQGCLSAAEAASWESRVRQQIAASNCSADSLTVAGGKISGEIACTSIHQPRVAIEGQYSDSAYAVNLVSRAVVNLGAAGASAQAPVQVLAKWTGKRLGACP